MRLFGVLAAVGLTACAGEKLAQAPPAHVDFTGRWTLNVADSDAPQRLIQAQFDSPGAGQSGAPAGGSGGRSSRQGGREVAGGTNLAGPFGAAMPSVSAMSEGLRWPGKQLDIQQVAGVVAFSSDGASRVCQPADGRQAQRASGRQPRARDVRPPRCGWTDKTLIVQGGDPDEEHPPYEEQYRLSQDGQRLIEVVTFKSGRSRGFTMSRVWDRAK